ncbi:hypothetical protein [Sagittula sp. S175]|uniref:hypothetical protein n=1 Tax=Sagittula sp. S175 TaxID=3415129 RepID=UPI003C7E240A
MKIKTIKGFVSSEDGAVTVDWVVLTAALVGLAIAAMALYRTSTFSLASNVSSVLVTESQNLTTIADSY